MHFSLSTWVEVIDWPELSNVLAFKCDILLLCKLSIFVADIANVDFDHFFIKIDESLADWVDVIQYRHMICTLTQSHRLAWLLEPTGANLRASGVYDSNCFRDLSH